MEARDLKTKKTLVISAICFPPVLIGPAILMGNIFRHFPKGSYHVLTGRLDHVWAPIDKDSMLPAPYTFSRYPSLQSGGNWRRRIRSFFRDIFALLEVTWKGLQIIRLEKIDSIFVIADHYVELAALLMHWLTGKKIVLWLPDLYYHPDHNYICKSRKFILQLLEPVVLRLANNVLVASEATKEYYKKRYGIETYELKHSVNLDVYNRLSNKQIAKDEVTIIYTGIVTHSHYDAILDMVKVVEKFDDFNIKFLLVTTSDSEELKQMGIDGERIFYKRADRTEIPEIQQSADILFLPMAFKYYSDLNIKTASPSKLPEYLAVGRPILVYAPSNSYYVRYAREHEYALVVDQPDCNQLRQAIIKLQSDENLRDKLVSNAQRTVKRYHDSVKIAEQLQTILGVNEN
ncbi:MAG: glycosyltransferase [Candidatus Scalindua sp.]